VHRRTGYRQALLAAVIAIEPELELRLAGAA
jgi:hypothetical protein